MMKKLVAGALFAGLAAGLVSVVLQFAFVQPLLLESELYESGQVVHFGTEQGAEHPVGDGVIDIMRDGLSVLFSIFTYAGYGLMLVAAMALAGARGIAVSARDGLMWGVAGFVAFQFAPAYGLAPELPGNAAADVTLRQIWWWATAGLTAVGLWLIAFQRGWLYWGIAVVVIALPHLVGAPHPGEYTGPVPPELAGEFAARALGTGMVAWVVLGLVAAHFWAEDRGAA